MEVKAKEIEMEEGRKEEKKVLGRVGGVKIMGRRKVEGDAKEREKVGEGNRNIKRGEAGGWP